MSVENPPQSLSKNAEPALAARTASPDTVSPEEMFRNAQNAASFLKALSHEGRLMILCHLGKGEKSVGELEALLGTRQAAVSQQLARLRLEGLVSCRRDGKTIYYSIEDQRVLRTISMLYDIFCAAG